MIEITGWIIPTVRTIFVLIVSHEIVVGKEFVVWLVDSMTRKDVMEYKGQWSVAHIVIQVR
jgi:hypothetical protein